MEIVEEIKKLKMIVVLIVLVFIGGCIALFIYDYSTRPKKFMDATNSIKENGGKIRYSNEKTGTISYIDKDGNYISKSVYRGYNFHCR